VDFGLLTSTIKILTNNWGSAASAKAAVEPVIPTETPQRRLQNPTVSPPQNNEYPVYQQEYTTWCMQFKTDGEMGESVSYEGE
jgi:hypothetical protein